jgi:hypothetical protein
MSGWDVSSTPTWGQQDGPDDTQAFTASGEGARDHGQDFGAPDFGGGYSGEGTPGGPPPEFFGQDYGQDQNMDLGPGGFPQRTPGRSLQDLPRRETRGGYGSAPAGGYGQQGGYGPDDGFDQDGPTQRLEITYGQGGGYGQDAGYGQGSAFGQNDAFDQGSTFRQEGGFGQDAAFGQEAAFGQDNSFRQDGGFGQEGRFGQEAAFGQDNSFRQEGGFGQDAAFGQDWGGGADQAQPDAWGQGGQDNDGGWSRTAGRSAAPWDERPQQDAGYGDADGFGRQDFGRQPEGPGYSAKDYAGQDIPGQQGRGTQESPEFGRMGRDTSARNDPALQDFFSPTRGGAGFSNQGPGRPGGEPRERFTQAPGDWAKPGGGGEPRERFTQAPGDWANPGRSSAPRPGTGTGPSRTPRGPRRDDPEPRRGLGMKGLIGIGAVVVVVIAVAAYVFIGHKSSGGTPTASGTSSGSTMTTPAAKPTGSKAAGASGAGTTSAYTLSTPSTAGGYPIGQDPNFLTMATTTAQQVSTAVTSGGGGTVTGKPVSAAYQLPDSQVITFVGYQGSFTPAKVKTILASLGTDPNTFPAGSLGGVLGCANTTTSPSGAVCVWSDSSTLGVTEFFSSTAPETLTPGSEQSLGASDTVKLRASVEKKAS